MAVLVAVGCDSEIPRTRSQRNLESRRNIAECISLLLLVGANYYIGTLPELPHYTAAIGRCAASLELRVNQAS